MQYADSDDADADADVAVSDCGDGDGCYGCETFTTWYLNGLATLKQCKQPGTLLLLVPYTSVISVFG